MRGRQWRWRAKRTGEIDGSAAKGEHMRSNRENRAQGGRDGGEKQTRGRFTEIQKEMDRKSEGI